MSIDGGLPEAIRHLVVANEASAHPCEISVLVQRGLRPEQVPIALEHTKFEVLRGRYARSIAEAWRHCSRARADVLVGTDFRLFMVALIAWTLRCRSPRQVTFWINSIPLVIEGRARTALFRLAARRCSLLFASAAIRDAHSYRWHRGRTSVVHYGIPDHGVRSTPRRDADPVILQYTAAFVGWKNHRTLLVALAQVLRDGWSVKLRLVGDGRELDEVQRLASHLGLDEHVEFTGARNDARELLASCDVYVHPSLGEGLGIAVVEAMYAELPIVASDSGAMPEYLEDGISAVLVDGSDPDELAAAIVHVLRRVRDSSAGELGQAARAAARSMFSMDRYVNEWVEAVASANPDSQ